MVATERLAPCTQSDLHIKAVRKPFFEDAKRRRRKNCIIIYCTKSVIFVPNLFLLIKFIHFSYKLYFIIFMLIFPYLVSLLIPFPLYDGLRLFLWALPYFCIIPGLTIYYLIENINFIKSKLALISLSVLIIYFLFNFFLTTPYQYTYLNIFNGKAENRYKKFENDYWGVSIYELLKHSNFDKGKTIKLATCGINSAQAKNYLRKRGYTNLMFSDLGQADYIIMTNRVFWQKNTDDLKDLKTCYDQFPGKTISSVKRKGLALSLIRSREI